jgi:hypothetical protein
MARAPDWLVHIDGLLCERYHHCTGCGVNIQGMKVFEGLYDAEACTVGYLVCGRCRAADPQDQRIAARLAVRYQGQP